MRQFKPHVLGSPVESSAHRGGGREGDCVERSPKEAVELRRERGKEGGREGGRGGLVRRGYCIYTPTHPSNKYLLVPSAKIAVCSRHASSSPTRLPVSPTGTPTPSNQPSSLHSQLPPSLPPPLPPPPRTPAPHPARHALSLTPGDLSGSPGSRNELPGESSPTRGGKSPPGAGAECLR